MLSEKNLVPSLAAVGVLFVLCGAGYPRSALSPATTDAIAVGSGIAGLSAAYGLGKGGAPVTIVDMASVFGGHAVMATGDLCLVGTLFQQARGVTDSLDRIASPYPVPTSNVVLRSALPS